MARKFDPYVVVRQQNLQGVMISLNDGPWGPCQSIISRLISLTSVRRKPSTSLTVASLPQLNWCIWPGSIHDQLAKWRSPHYSRPGWAPVNMQLRCSGPVRTGHRTVVVIARFTQPVKVKFSESNHVFLKYISPVPLNRPVKRIEIYPVEENCGYSQARFWLTPVLSIHSIKYDLQ